MTSTSISPPVSYMRPGVFRAWCFFLLFCFQVWPQTGFSYENPVIPAVTGNDKQAWLITFGPGELYFERFGHNAIWLREPAAGLDHTFNFGYFDFEQEDFFLRFMRGRMLYFSIAQPAEREFDHYRRNNRSIRAQKLNLTVAQFEQLRDYLLNQVQPENRDYRYDYYLDNCSTRIRDALDIALDGALSDRTGQIPAVLNFRDHTRRLTQMQFWYYLGLETGLGFPVDRAVSRWDEMFIPMVVAEELATMSVEPADAGIPLVEVDTMLYSSTLAVPDAVPTETWHRYLLLGLFLTGLAWLSGKLMPPVWIEAVSRAWVLISATMGLILAALWLLTDHQASSRNANLLLLNPLLILALVPGLQRIVAVLLIVGNILALLLLLLPVHQYNLDVAAVLTPINMALAIHFLKKKSETSI